MEVIGNLIILEFLTVLLGTKEVFRFVFSFPAFYIKDLLLTEKLRNVLLKYHLMLLNPLCFLNPWTVFKEQVYTPFRTSNFDFIIFNVTLSAFLWRVSLATCFVRLIIFFFSLCLIVLAYYANVLHKSGFFPPQFLDFELPCICMKSIKGVIGDRILRCFQNNFLTKHGIFG